jgi:hypothetical protein
MTIVAPTVNETRADREDPSWTFQITHAERLRRARASRPSMANTAVPALMQTPGLQIPVWEITSERGRRSYVRRQHVPGHRPIGCLESFVVDGQYGPIHVDVCVASSTTGVVHASSLEHEEVPGTIVIPLSYYEPLTV